MDLKFDEMSVDTSLARDYIKKEHNGTGSNFDQTQYRSKDLPTYLRELVIKLKENKNLISQLEYLVREIPIADTIAQLDLIIQQLNYVSSRPVCVTEFVPVTSNEIIFSNGSPLLLLGGIAKIMQNGNKCVNVLHDEKTKAICTLIANLCQDIRLPVLTQKLLVNRGVYQTPLGTVGVISENSDVESAVDILLASSKHVPWRLQRILVQESVYQQFQSALSWKCKLNKLEKNDSIASSSDVLQYNGRVFLLDLASSAELNPQTMDSVLVEAYRTRKELKLLLNQYQPHSLSLWANDIAEINEIAYSIPSPVVWVNNFADFRGPPKITEALFYHESYSYKINVKELWSLKESWIKLDLETRRSALCKALDECATIDKTNKSYGLVKNALQKIDTSASNAFIHVGKDYVCMGIPTPSNRFFINISDFLNTPFFISVLHGNAFVLTDQTTDEIFGIFKKAGIPIVQSSSSDESKNSCFVYGCNFSDDHIVEFTQGTKVIWTNSGTIFAN